MSRYSTEFLSQGDVCAIYQCLEGHIHLRYRTLDITMDANDFFQVADVFSEAVRILQEAEQPVTEELNLENMDVSIKV